MPSWNIHIAQTERLLEKGRVLSQVVRDKNAFLFGNVVPDIYVGYMVPGIVHPISYRITHFAAPELIPRPREREFWDCYVAPLAEDASLAEPAPVALVHLRDEYERMNRVHYPKRYASAPPPEDSFDLSEPFTAADMQCSVLDLTLGAWAHLLADKIWNARVRDFLDAKGARFDAHFRIKKQGDFDTFGRTLDISSVPVASERLCAAAATFPQYPIDENCVYASIGVIHEIVRSNGGAGMREPYRLLCEGFFEKTFDEVLETTETIIAQRL